MAKPAVLELLDSLQQISRKISVTGKSQNFQTRDFEAGALKESLCNHKEMLGRP